METKALNISSFQALDEKELFQVEGGFVSVSEAFFIASGAVALKITAPVSVPVFVFTTALAIASNNGW